MRLKSNTLASFRVVATALAIVALVLSPLVPAQQATAANANDFSPGNIISDSIFYDSETMSTAEIQSFLNERVAACRSGYTCLKSYSQATSNQPRRSEGCTAYTGATAETAARIIYKVATACGINPQVLLVLLEKEQGLVSDSWPSERQYRSATGYGCPDTADCDKNFYGFFNQVYHAAYQFKKYQYNPGIRNYQAGRNNTILWNPNSSCGSSQVYIENQATAALYVYTPYQPNRAALSNLYGTGDSCSAYGNRNFWRMFSDWFGSPTGFPVRGGIAAKYNALGSANGPLGSSTGPEVCNLKDSGCYQNFRSGAITWTPKIGAFATWGGIRTRWAATDFERGHLGYPTSDERCGMLQRGCYQMFEGGAVTWTASTGAWETTGVIREAWSGTDFERGPLRYPISAVSCGLVEGRCYQDYQGGAVISHPTEGTWASFGGIRARWSATDFERGPLGFPSGAEVCGLRDGGCYQSYQNGAITWTPALGGWESFGPIRSFWQSTGFELGPLGYPSAGANCGLTSGGCTQQFQRGLVVTSPMNGTWALVGGVGMAWAEAGGVTSAVGYPKSGEIVTAAGVVQNFERGTATWDRTSGKVTFVVTTP